MEVLFCFVQFRKYLLPSHLLHDTRKPDLKRPGILLLVLYDLETFFENRTRIPNAQKHKG
jgi:hypothetical protein